MDRGYIHFKRLYALAQAAVFFVVRARDNMQYRRRYSHPVDKTTGLRSDQTIVLTGVGSSANVPFTVGSDSSWLTATPTSGTTQSTITIHVNQSG